MPTQHTKRARIKMKSWHHRHHDDTKIKMPSTISKTVDAINLSKSIREYLTRGGVITKVEGAER